MNHQQTWQEKIFFVIFNFASLTISHVKWQPCLRNQAWTTTLKQLQAKRVGT